MKCPPPFNLRALGAAASFCLAVATAPGARASNFGTGGTELSLDDGDVAVHVFTESGTFALSESRFAEVLLVGGGGGGGYDSAGGGGGGGVVHVEVVKLEAGEYSIVVGAGGAGGSSSARSGGIGGASTLTAPDGTVLYKALGGGGGGGWSSTAPTSTAAAPFASGGGGANGKLGASPGDPTQGHSGGSGGKGSSCPAGGGGAGGNADPMIVTDGKGGKSGNGGPGYVCSITGAAESYGAGGGGGGYNANPGVGGNGIGGHGFRHSNDPTGDEEGRAGFGGGGGGGGNLHYAGAAGGSGTVILRFANVAATTEEPVFDWMSTQEHPDNFVFSLTSTSAGLAASDDVVDVLAEVSESADAWDANGAFSGEAQTLLEGTVIGEIKARLIGLRPSHAYFVRLVVRNDGGAAAYSDIRSLSTPALIYERWTLDGIAGQPGLWQNFYGGTKMVETEVDPTSPDITVQIGTIAAGIANHTQNGAVPIHGSSYLDSEGRAWGIGANLNYAYRGWIFLEGGKTYHFFGRYWDVVRLVIDGQTLIRREGAATATASLSPETSGWHDFRAWVGTESGNNFGVTPGWTLGLGWNADGEASPSGVPGSGWFPFENGEDGGEYLRTVPTGRTVDIASADFDAAAGTATFGAALGESWDETALYAVWGPFHGGDTTNEWTHVVPVAAVGADAAEESFTVPDVADLRYFRFVAIDEKGLCAWSESRLYDPSAPAIAIAGVTHDGDRATVSVRVDSVGTGDFSLRLLWGAADDLSDATVETIPVSGVGSYDVELVVEPGSTTWFRAEAETTDGASDATAIDSFTTLAGSVLATTVATSSTIRTWTFSGTLAEIGCGETTVTLLIGESEDDLAPLEPSAVASDSGAWTMRLVLPGVSGTRYWKIVSRNESAGGVVWTSETPVRTLALSEKGVNYTWKKDVALGEWDDAANWTTGSPNVLGYPADEETYTFFPAGTEARIHVAGLQLAGYARLDSAGSTIVFQGDGPDKSELRFHDAAAGTMNGETIIFDNLTADEYDIFDYQIGSPASTGSRLVATNGAVVKFGGYDMGIVGTNACIEVRSGASVLHDDPDTTYARKSPNAGHLVFGAVGQSLLLDDGTLSTPRVHVATLAEGGGQSFRIRGPGGRLLVTGGVFGDTAGLAPAGNNQLTEYMRNPAPLTEDFDIVFEPVGGPFTNLVTYAAGDETVAEAVPLVSTADSGRAFGAMVLGESAGKIRLSVDTSSMRGSSRGAKQHFLLWKAGIDVSHVELVQGPGYALAWTYGWPSVLSAPESAGDLPTGVRAEVPGSAGTVIVIR